MWPLHLVRGLHPRRFALATWAVSMALDRRRVRAETLRVDVVSARGARALSISALAWMLAGPTE